MQDLRNRADDRKTEAVSIGESDGRMRVHVPLDRRAHLIERLARREPAADECAEACVAAAERRHEQIPGACEAEYRLRTPSERASELRHLQQAAGEEKRLRV